MTKGQKLGAFAVAVVCGAALVWLWIARPAVCRYEACGEPLETPIAAILTLVLVVDVPICFLILIGKPPLMTLAPLIPSAEERANRKRLKERQILDDDAFYERFYAGTGIPKEIPLCLRRVYTSELFMAAVWPEDKAVEFDGELDFGRVLWRVQREFGVQFMKEDIRDIDGSFDSVVQLVARSEKRSRPAHWQKT
jgi:hypothetical protein